MVLGQLVRKRLLWMVIRDLEVFLKRDRRVKQGSLELQELPLLVAQEPQDNEDYREKWGRLGRSELSVSRVLLVCLEFLGFLEFLDLRVHKVSWVLLGELVPWAVQELTELQVRKVLQAPWGSTARMDIMVQRAREATLAMRQV